MSASNPLRQSTLTDGPVHLLEMTCRKYAKKSHLTQVGRSFASRVCGSLLTAAGIPELICAGPDTY